MKNTKMSSIFMVCQMLDKNARFPDEISYGSMGGPTFSTNVTTLANGGEQRKINWSYPRCRYNVIYGVKSYSQYEVLMDFFYAHRGKAFSFRFKDWSDYKASMQHVGSGDGTSLLFQLIKKYSAGSYSYTRLIRKPVEGTVNIWIEEAPQLENTHYTTDYNTGQVSFLEAPKLGVKVYASFEFDILARFDTDFLTCSLDGCGNYGCQNIHVAEVKDS
ncbi:hypothetical protein ANAPC5_00813 [Anaplasma phagocytophilum]|nr:hypothetical protein ANAPC2_00233 [Anaplasma phagocytophilum]SBO32836.1 hypothetical protein ANAPC3_01008 [Anaplasma phagocytophilum]SBO32961.1 hypothetical protein ANAPC4_00988 [Anaplasma phagocytophilum]SCV64254.1 hypothetical protein ANAPC5_00813 [Anaplasma phagocytophilum]